MIAEIAEIEYVKLKEAYVKVFSGTDPNTDCFNMNIEKVSLLLPVENFILTKDQYIALMRTLSVIGDNEELFISEIEGQSIDDVFTPFAQLTPFAHFQRCKTRHFVTDLNTSYEEYEQTQMIFENAIYSSKGNWGIIISQEDYALIGGDGEFIETYRSLFPEIDQSLELFYEYWEYEKRVHNRNLDWYDEFINSLKR